MMSNEWQHARRRVSLIIDYMNNEWVHATLSVLTHY